MPSYREIQLNLYGVWRLLHLEEAALGWFDTSIEGYWKSFFAAILVLPAFTLMHLVRPVPMPEDAVAAGFAITLGANIVSYVYLWIAWPAMALVIANLLGRRDKYVRYVVAYNWALVWQYYVLLPVVIVAAVLGDNGTFLLVVAEIMVLAFVWYIARTALSISGLAALGLLVCDVVLTEFVIGMKFFMMG